MQHIEVGYICVKVNPKTPVGIFESCLEDPEEHEKVFQHDWCNTGDKATRDDEEYFTFVGSGAISSRHTFRIGEERTGGEGI